MTNWTPVTGDRFRMTYRSPLKGGGSHDFVFDAVVTDTFINRFEWKRMTIVSEIGRPNADWARGCPEAGGIAYFIIPKYLNNGTIEVL